MRYFFAGYFLLAVLVVAIAGFRGSESRKPPLEVFPDMDRQMKLQPQHSSRLFADGRGSRTPVPGTIARTEPYALAAESERRAYAFEESPVTTGIETGSTNFVAANPFEITPGFMERGRNRFQIYCTPCHGTMGEGNGITKQFGMAAVANLHDPRIVRMADGELFHVITNGRNLMGSYAGVIDVPDRWAIVAYLRALHLSRLGTIDDVPPAMRSNLQ